MSSIFHASPSGSKFAIMPFAAKLQPDGKLIIDSKNQIHDGDTIKLSAMPPPNFSVRFLGIDTPEISLPIPGRGKTFHSLGNPAWQNFLSQNPFPPKFAKQLTKPLLSYLRKILTPHFIGGVQTNVAANHYNHALDAKIALETEIKNDINALNLIPSAFLFYVSFSYEIFDSGTRLLAFLNRYQKTKPRPLTYNERQLKAGMAVPYFIWPNISPFRKLANPFENLKPSTFRKLINNDTTLQKAIKSVQSARHQKLGIYNPSNPLILLPYELRFISRQRPPNRWLIDLSSSSNKLIPPKKYFLIKSPEHRLFIPEEFVSLFFKNGWKK